MNESPASPNAWNDALQQISKIVRLRPGADLVECVAAVRDLADDRDRIDALAARTMRANNAPEVCVSAMTYHQRWTLRQAIDALRFSAEVRN